MDNRLVASLEDYLCEVRKVLLELFPQIVVYEFEELVL